MADVSGGLCLRKRTGAIRRSLPATSWDAQPLASFLSDPTLADAERYARSQDERHHSFLWGESFGTRTAALLNQWTSPNDGAVATANKIYQGKFRLFETHEIHLGDSPNWHRDPFTNRQYPSDRHWTQLGDFDGGDIKLVWELSRFSWVYPLVRAYWRTTDERFPQRFWQLIASWCDANPPQSGVHWKCGQEIALRLLAACFGLFGFASSAQTTPQCRVMIAQLVAVSAQRIAANLKYALSQQNNHGIVEATGLWTTGLLFAELKDAGDWANLGRKALESQIRDLIDDDGAFSQHSVNYQRVMLHACLWAIRLGSVHGQPLSDEFIQRVSRAGEFLQALMDENSGRLPRYGQNDGALVLPLSECTPDDYRPVIQATARITTGGACLPPGPWEEESLWLCGADTFPQEPVENRNSGDWFAASGGYQVLRSKSGKVFTRAGRFRSSSLPCGPAACGRVVARCECGPRSRDIHLQRTAAVGQPSGGQPLSQLRDCRWPRSDAPSEPVPLAALDSWTTHDLRDVSHRARDLLGGNSQRIPAFAGSRHLPARHPAARC